MDSTLLTPDEVASLLRQLPNWESNGTCLTRVLEFTDFREAFAFMVRVAKVAEDLNHHPDWSNSWNRVVLAVTTHRVGGLTSRDIEFAKKVDTLIGC